MTRRRRAGSPRSGALDALWAHHHGELRDPQQIVAQWQPASEVDPALLRYEARGKFWEALGSLGRAVLVTREYEHLVIALALVDGRPRVSFLRLPHPNCVAVHPDGARVCIASTRNPNVVFDFSPSSRRLERDGPSVPAGPAGPLVPVQARYLPGALYVHDLAFIGRQLHANAVALNAVVAIEEYGGFRPVWWPHSIDGPRGPRFGRNYLQLNSIAAGRTIRESYFSASAGAPSARRPGHLNFPVDRRGVIFSGRTRDVVATGLTRPHSARLHRSRLWVDNSGYGEVGVIEDGRFEAVARLPGWTRGLLVDRGMVFVGTSRVIPRFRHYAPGVDPATSVTGVHALDAATGRLLGSLVWPMGNQIFAVEALRGMDTCGFPHALGEGGRRRWRHDVFFAGVP